MKIRNVFVVLSSLRLYHNLLCVVIEIEVHFGAANAKLLKNIIIRPVCSEKLFGRELEFAFAYTVPIYLVLRRI